MDFEDSDNLQDKADAVRAAETAALRAAEADEDEKKKGRGAALDDGNPATAELGANIRPEVQSVPGGLVTVTTQKSATFAAERDGGEGAAIDRDAIDAEMFLEDRDEWSAAPQMTAAEFITSRIAEARTVEAGADPVRESEEISRHNEQQAESGRSENSANAELHADAGANREHMTAAEFIASRIADAKADAAERGEKDQGQEIEAGAERARGRDGPDIF